MPFSNVKEFLSSPYQSLALLLIKQTLSPDHDSYLVLKGNGE